MTLYIVNIPFRDMNPSLTLDTPRRRFREVHGMAKSATNYVQAAFEKQAQATLSKLLEIWTTFA